MPTLATEYTRFGKNERGKLLLQLPRGVRIRQESKNTSTKPTSGPDTAHWKDCPAAGKIPQS
jgi:hypothetical protein